MLSLQRSFERASQTAAELPRIPQLEPLYRNLDMHIHKGDLVMIAGRSGSQKSGLAMFITAMLNQPALYISGDMTPWEASTRIISLNTQHTTAQIQQNIDDYGPEYYRDSIHHGAHITFSFQSPITWTDITMELQAYMEMWNTFPPIIVIDNLMDIQDCESDYQAQQEAMQWITALGRDTGSTIIVTHHATDKTGSDIEHPRLGGKSKTASPKNHNSSSESHCMVARITATGYRSRQRHASLYSNSAQANPAQTEPDTKDSEPTPNTHSSGHSPKNSHGT